MGIKDVILVLLLLPNMVDKTVTISDVVTKDTSFYYRQFQTFPSKLVTLEYSVVFNMTRINKQCGGEVCRVILDIYTTEYDQNLKTNCSNDSFGQLRNENLRIPLKPRYRPYRFTTCKLDELDSNMLHCEGTTTSQDYKPRHYGFSLSYKCSAPVKPSLVGLSYNFTISIQSNKTQCVPFQPTLPATIKECKDFCNHMSLPNMIGDIDFPSVWRWSSQFDTYEPLISYILSQLPTGGCHKYQKEVICRIIFPECDQFQNQVTHLCKESCLEFAHSCLKQLQTVLSAHSSQFGWWSDIANGNISDALNCDYLPSVIDPIPCYYKPVTCQSPPNVTNARISNGTESNGTYMAMSQVEYECLDETFQMEGNSTVTCQYSGEWYKMPRCLTRKDNNKYKPMLNPLSIVIPLLITSFFLFIIVHTVRRYICRRKKVLLLKRNREYDAFVCYNFDEDNDFVVDSIIPELEEKHHPPFKMFIHDRDFELGQLITTNINNAINKCNSAIIVMSQGFIDSPICREEFTKCLRENEKDPAFKLFIIMMKEVNTLGNVPENMQNYFEEKTYVKREDPELFEKIGKHLKLMREHDVMDDNIELERLIMNHDEA